jgi:flavin reductase (DIM6/NTAB) family NADH-FMN oxidoreductase RutF
VRAPLIEECLAHIECKVVELIEHHPIIVLDGLAACVNPARREQRTLHAVGDGRFRVDGRTMDRRRMMAAKLPRGEPAP